MASNSGVSTLRNFCWAVSPPLSRRFLICLLAFMEQIGHRTYKHTTPAERARKPLIQAGFKRLNNSPAVENKRFYSAFNPIPALSHLWERGQLWRIYPPPRREGRPQWVPAISRKKAAIFSRTTFCVM